jgi:hypothetical protein
MKKTVLFFAIFLLAQFAWAQSPTISGFGPSSARPQTTVIILGFGFSTVASNNTLWLQAYSPGGVQLGAHQIPVISSTTTQLMAYIPIGAQTGYFSMSSIGSPYTALGLFTVLYPTISSFSPIYADSGTIVTILGKYFTGATSVSFGGTNASSFTIVSDTVITATVGSGTSGNVSVVQSALVGAPGSGSGSMSGFIYGCSWTGAVSTAWENPSNWSCETLPDSTTNVIIGSGNVILNSNVTVKSMTLSPTANFTINSGFNLTIAH